METIIAATDFSKAANNAVDYAASLARFLDARLVLVHAFSPPLGGYDMAAPLETLSDLRNDATDKLKVIRDQLICNGYNFRIDCKAGLGSVVEVINEEVNTYSADLVVMGMAGEGAKIKEHLIGSNTLRVADRLSHPLLVISEQVHYKPIHNVCLAAEMKGLDGSTLLYLARDVANMFDATLEVVTVEKPDKEGKWEKPENYSFIDRRLANTRHKQVTLREDKVALALEYYFKFHETDLVMVNPKKHNIFQKLFSGSITRHMAFHISVPLMILH